MTSDARVTAVKSGLTQVMEILLDIDDQLAGSAGPEPSPLAWVPAMDDFRAALVELARLTAILRVTTTAGHATTRQSTPASCTAPFRRRKPWARPLTL